MEVSQTEALKRLRETLGVTKLHNREPGWLDIWEIMDDWGVNDNVARKRLNKAKRAGLVEAQEVFDPRAGKKIKVWRAKDVV